MKTKKQEELVKSYLAQFENEISLLFQDLAMYLSELGYNPKKVGPSISFTNDIHGKQIQIAKFGVSTKKNETPVLWFALRFSACKDYSQRFTDIVRDTIIKVTTTNPHRLANCVIGKCNACPGEPDSHIYTSVLPNGEKISSCGGYALKIPNISADDVSEIKMLIKEEHEYLISHENKHII